MDEKNEIYFNFSYYALNLLGKQMYTNKWSAISELVANGLDAGATDVFVYINSTNKKKSTIEIFDNGRGMNYDDLSNKYALIGRNKRIDENDLISNKTKGRKGVGKLAGLYLSKKYFLITKKNSKESSWVLDSSNVSDSDIPMLTRFDKKKIYLDNQKKWSEFSQGTLIKLVDVDLTNFAERKLDGLKRRISDYYLLDSINSNIYVAYNNDPSENPIFEKVKKEVAFGNFYAFFESKKGLKSKELRKAIKFETSTYPEINTKERKVIKLDPNDFSKKVSLSGVDNFLDIDGNSIRLPYELTGWIGIHSTINVDEAKKNDERFIKNAVYSPNRLKLYVRDKLAVDNFLDYLNNSQAFSNYIEGEISFDILDDNRLPDISTTSREGLSAGDDRVNKLIEMIKVIVNRLIKDRINISTVMKQEEEALRAEEKEKIKREKDEERRIRRKTERENIELNNTNVFLKKENISLDNQNKMKDILLNKEDPHKQKLLVHELTVIRNEIIDSVEDIAAELVDRDEFNEISIILAGLKRNSDKLASIRDQFLKLNDYDIIGNQNFDLRNYMKSFFSIQNLDYLDLKIDIGNNPFFVKAEIFDLGVLFDNLISNAVAARANTIKIEFPDDSDEIHIISDTGPIEISPIEDIFKLGKSSKTGGTGIGLYLVKSIVEELNWKISVISDNDNVEFVIKPEVVKE